MPVISGSPSPWAGTGDTVESTPASDVSLPSPVSPSSGFPGECAESLPQAANAELKQSSAASPRPIHQRVPLLVLLARPIRFAIPLMVREASRSASTNPRAGVAFQCLLRRKRAPRGHVTETLHPA